jgi:hypothetical protein
MLNPCQGTTKTGEPCPKGAMNADARVKWAVPDDTPPLCYWCFRGGSDVMKTRGGKASHAARRRRKEQTAAAAVSGYRYEELIAVVAPALVAVIDEPGFPRVPDWGARLCAVALLLEMQPDWVRETPEQQRELLERILPDTVADVRLDPERAYIALAQEKHMLRERGHELARAASAGS